MANTHKQVHHTTGKEFTRHTLTAKEKFKFHQYLSLHYTEFGLGDTEFAKKAEEELGLPISASMVVYARKDFEIPVNAKEKGSTGWQIELIKRVEELEAQVATLMRERNGRGH